MDIAFKTVFICFFKLLKMYQLCINVKLLIYDFFAIFIDKFIIWIGKCSFYHFIYFFVFLKIWITLPFWLVFSERKEKLWQRKTENF